MTLHCMPHYRRCLLIIIVAKINGRAFLSLNENRLERSGVSLGFQCTLMDIIEDLVCTFMQNNNVNKVQNNDLCFVYTYIHVQKRSQQPQHDDRKAPSSPQQSPTSSVHVTTPSTTLTQPTSPNARQQTKIGKLLLSLILWDIYMSTWIYYYTNVPMHKQPCTY